MNFKQWIITIAEFRGYMVKKIKMQVKKGTVDLGYSEIKNKGQLETAFIKNQRVIVENAEGEKFLLDDFSIEELVTLTKIMFPKIV